LRGKNISAGNMWGGELSWYQVGLGRWGVPMYILHGFLFPFLSSFSDAVQCYCTLYSNVSPKSFWLGHVFLTYLILYWFQHCLKIFFTTLCITTNNDIRSKINNSSVHSRWG
jgi:hypothetical protein